MSSDERRTRSVTSPADLETRPTQVTPSVAATQASGRNVSQLAPEERIFPAGIQIAGRYRILDVLGVGGMGVVYKAYDEMLDVEMALKVLRPEIAADDSFIQRFRNELVLARQVSHRHVVSNYDLGIHEGLHFMTMDLVIGRSLEEILREKGKLELEEAERITRQVAGALAEAHRQGIVHRDLKPGNILIDGDGDAYVTDFGIARSYGSNLTKTGEILGTPDYLSPEQARGEKVDGRSDIFTLGIIFIQLISGKLPFPGGTLLEIVAQRMAGKVQGLDELGLEKTPPRISRVIERCVEKDPAKRYQTAAEILEDLEEGTRRGRPEKRSFKTILPWVAALLVIVVLGAVLLKWLPLPSRPADPTADSIVPATPPSALDPPPAALPAPEPQHSVAVLPFSEVTDSRQLAWAATGVAEMLATALAENGDLRVVESVRVFQILRDLGFRPSQLQDTDLRQLAELLRVDRLVFGNLHMAAEQIQLSLILMEADLPGSPSRQVATERGDLRQLFDMVDLLAASLSEALEVESADRSPSALTPSTAAMEAYTEGLELLSWRDTLKAAPALEKAVQADPEFVTAWVRLSQAYQDLGRYDDALNAARKATQSAGSLSGRIVYEARAQEALLQGKPEEAQRYLENLVASYPNDTAARIALAEAYGQQGKFAEAIYRLLECVQVDPSARAWYLLGRFSILSGDLRPAVDEYLVQALIQQKKIRNEQGQGEVYNALGVAYERLGQMDQAVESYKTAAQIRRRVGDQGGLAKTLQNLGVLYFVGGNYQAAEDNIEMALEINTDLGNDAGIAELYNAYGAMEEEQGKYPEALDYYRRALNIRNDLGDERAVAESRTNVGFVYSTLGEYDNALLYLERALELYRKNEDQRGVTLTLQSVGFCQLAQGNWPQATRSFLESLELSRTTGEKIATSVSHGNLGRIAQYQGRYAAAMSAYKEAQQIVAELGDTRGQVEFTLNEAEALIELGRLGRAALKLDQVEGWLSGGGNHEQRVALLTLRGHLLLRQGDVDEAEKAFAEAAVEAEASQSPAASIKVRVGSGLRKLAAGRAAGAVEELRPAVSDADRLGNAILQLRAGEALARAHLLTGDLDAAEDLLRKTLRVSDNGESYAGAFRLHQLLAQVLDQKADVQGTAEALATARDELDRLRRNLDEELRRTFDQLPEVRDLLDPASP